MSVIFSDEKNFVVDAVKNRRNDRYISTEALENVPDNVKHHVKTKSPTSDGKKCPIIFIPQGLKVNTAVYLDLLNEKVKPWLEKTYPDGNYVWQQDGAPAHTSRTTQEWLQSEEGFPNFWEEGDLGPHRRRT